MEATEVLNYPYVIAVVVVGALVTGWLVYRNMKDEKKFERDLDKPGQQVKRPHDDATKI